MEYQSNINGMKPDFKARNKDDAHVLIYKLSLSVFFWHGVACQLRTGKSFEYSI